MPAGKSSERLAEEIGAFTPNSEPLFALTPIDVYKTTTSQLTNPDFTGYTLRDLPDWPKVFNGFFVSSRTHIQVESDRNLHQAASEEIEHDWQLADRSSEGNIVALTCALTGAQLTINTYDSEIPITVRRTFSLSALAARSDDASSATPSWQMFARIISDLIKTSPNERRNISKDNIRPSQLLDLDLVLPFLGFQFDPETRLFRPPIEASPDYLRWLRRILLEVKMEISGLDARVPVLPAVSRFLGCADFGDAHLSPASYGCLGAVTTFSDERLLTRFELAMQNDGVQGGPWYLESLKDLTQQTKSEVLETRLIELLSLGTPTLSSLEEEFSKVGLTLESQKGVGDEELLELAISVPSEDVTSLYNAICSVRPSQTWQRISAAPSLSPEEALRVFATDSIDDDIIAERFRTIWNNGTNVDKVEARYALRTLGLSTRSSKLLALYEDVAPPSRTPRPSYEEALARLGLTPDVSDQDIEAIFEANTDDAQGNQLLELRQALSVIATERQSQQLLTFLGHETSMDLIDLNTEQAAGPRMPVGLWNIGNTCYLNSLLQFYYSLPRVREYVANYEEPHPVVHPVTTTEPDAPAKSDQASSTQSVSERLDELPAYTEVHPSKSESSKMDCEEESERKEDEEDDDEEEDSSSAQSEELSSAGAKTQDSDMPNNVQLISPVSSSEPEEVPSTVAPTPDRSMYLPTESKKIGGRVVPPKEIRRSQIFVDRLGKLFRQIRDTPTAHITPSEILAYMALVPPNEDADDVIAAEGPNEESALRGRLIGALQRQQDVTECIENVLDQLEATMDAEYNDKDDGEQQDLIKELFYGSTLQTLIRINDGKNRRTKKERFSSLLLDVSDGPTPIYDALDNYFGDDVLDLEDGSTLRTLRLSSVPDILQIQVQRVQFDKRTYLPYKNLNPLIFPEKIYLDRYLETSPGSDLDQRTQKLKSMREELQSIEGQLEANGSIIERRNALSTTLEWLAEAQSSSSDPSSSSSENESRRPLVSDATLEEVKKHHQELCEKLATLESRRDEIKNDANHIFDDMQEYGYRIHSLFIHKGDVSYGHYWIYIRDMETGEFYKYNDEIVTHVSLEEVFNFQDGNLATPYFLVFVRDR